MARGQEVTTSALSTLSERLEAEVRRVQEPASARHEQLVSVLEGLPARLRLDVTSGNSSTASMLGEVCATVREEVASGRQAAIARAIKEVSDGVDRMWSDAKERSDSTTHQMAAVPMMVKGVLSDALVCAASTQEQVRMIGGDMASLATNQGKQMERLEAALAKLDVMKDESTRNAVSTRVRGREGENGLHAMLVEGLPTRDGYEVQMVRGQAHQR